MWVNLTIEGYVTKGVYVNISWLFNFDPNHHIWQTDSFPWMCLAMLHMYFFFSIIPKDLAIVTTISLYAKAWVAT